MARYKTISSGAGDNTYHLIDNENPGVPVLAYESFTLCDTVASHLNGDYTDDLSEAYEIAQSIAHEARS